MIFMEEIQMDKVTIELTKEQQDMINYCWALGIISQLHKKGIIEDGPMEAIKRGCIRENEKKHPDIALWISNL